MSSRYGVKVLLMLAAWALPAVAYAEATVRVELRGPDGAPANGTVVLTRGETRHACATEKGECAMQDVEGGLYTVTVEQPGKTPPKPREVMIPPSGEVSLIVRGGK